MRFTLFLTATAFSSTLFAATTPAPATNDVASILEALRENNPEDAEAAATVMKIKLRRRDAAPQVSNANDINSILAALEANNPEDAQAARQMTGARGTQKRQDDLNSILAALEANNPEDAQAARQMTGAGGVAGKGAGNGVAGRVQ